MIEDPGAKKRKPVSRIHVSTFSVGNKLHVHGCSPKNCLGGTTIRYFDSETGSL